VNHEPALDAPSSAIARAIHDRGPIGFDAFMEIALYGPGGYYERPPIGAEGDFVTSPHVHWWFAYALAVVLGELHDAIGTDRPARLVELGAGDGTLARQLLEIVAAAGPVDYTAVDRSAGARSSLGDVPGVRVAATVDDVPDLEETLVFANELLDNLPFRRIRRRGDGLVEVRVDARAGELVEVETDPPADVPEDVLARIASSLPDGGDAAVPVGALALVDALAARMRTAYALLIDYAAERGTDVHGYRRHRVTGDVLEAPGSRDVTAGVDFDAIEARAREQGLAVLGRVTQRDVLLALGVDAWMTRERTSRVAASAPGGIDAVRAWSGRSRASLLVDAAGLGAHRWLLLATPDLPVPAWLERAQVRATDRGGPESG